MPDIESRFKSLSEYDSVSAELLRDAFEQSSAPLQDLPTEMRHTEEAQVIDWLATQEAPPDILILPAPTSYHQIETLLQMLPDTSRIFIMERNINRAKHLFSNLPIETLIAEGRLRMALGTSEEVMDYQLITLLDLPKCPTISVFLDNLEASDDAEFYRNMLLKIRNRIQMKTLNLSTVTHLGPLWQYNTLKNIPFIVSNPGTKCLTGILKDKPAIIVAAGPSLNEALKHLKPVAKRYAIIAVGTALKPLLKAGIRPDLVVTVDASHKVASQFDVPCDDLCIASSSIIFPDLLPRFSKVFTGYVNANIVGKWISTRFEDKGTIMAGGTVSATAIALAVQMGCRTIVTIGMDLAMASDGSSHARDTMYHGHVVTRGLSSVPGNYATTVHTNTQFKTYIGAISDLVQLYPSVTFINATHQGAKIDGMTLALPSHLSRFCSSEFNASDIIRNAHDNSAITLDTCAICEELDKWQKAVADIHTQALTAAQLCNTLIVTMKNPALSGTEEIMDSLEKLKQIDFSIMNNEYAPVIEMSLRPIFYDMGSALAIKSDLENHSIESMRRSRALFQQIAGAAKWAGELLNDAISRLSFDAKHSCTQPETMLMSA